MIKNPKPCRNCGKKFRTRHPRLYCSDFCSTQYRATHKRRITRKERSKLHQIAWDKDWVYR